MWNPLAIHYALKRSCVWPPKWLRINEDHGAMKIEASASALEMQFVTRAGTLIDRVTL